MVRIQRTYIKYLWLRGVVDTGKLDTTRTVGMTLTPKDIECPLSVREREHHMARADEPSLLPYA